MKKRIIALILALVSCLCLTVHAKNVPDLTQNGSITIVFRWALRPLQDGEMALYRVGDIREDNGNYTFVPVPELADSRVNLNDLDDPALARRLADLAVEKDLKPLTAEIRNGEARFEDVTPGLYVVVQTRASTGFAEISPFLISMPRYEDGEYITDVVAKPKVPVIPEPSCPTEPTNPSEPSEPTCPSEPSEPTGPSEPSEPTCPSEPSDPTGPSEPSEPTKPSEPTEPSVPDESTEPDETTVPSEPTEPTEPPKPELPQTGQLNWPVPVLAMTGMFFLVLGWLLCFGRKREPDET